VARVLGFRLTTSRYLIEAGLFGMGFNNVDGGLFKGEAVESLLNCDICKVNMQKVPCEMVAVV